MLEDHNDFIFVYLIELLKLRRSSLTVPTLKVSKLNNGKSLCVSSTKGATGHLLGAAGAVEAAFTVMSLVEKIVPPTRNLRQSDCEAKLHYPTSSETVSTLNVAMSNSFGFGGTNASLLFKSYDE